MSLCLGIVSMAVANDRYEFSLVDVRAYGSQYDSGVLSASKFGHAIIGENKAALDLPNASNLPNTTDKIPFYFVGDEAFPLRNNIMRLYPGKHLEVRKKIFN